MSAGKPRSLNDFDVEDGTIACRHGVSGAMNQWQWAVVTLRGQGSIGNSTNIDMQAVPQESAEIDEKQKATKSSCHIFGADLSTIQ